MKRKSPGRWQRGDFVLETLTLIVFVCIASAVVCRRYLLTPMLYPLGPHPCSRSGEADRGFSLLLALHVPWYSLHRPSTIVPTSHGRCQDSIDTEPLHTSCLRLLLASVLAIASAAPPRAALSTGTSSNQVDEAHLSHPRLQEDRTLKCGPTLPLRKLPIDAIQRPLRTSPLDLDMLDR